MVDAPVDGGQRHGRVGEDLAPFTERLVGGDEDRAPLVAGANQIEQHAGLRLILGDVGDVVEDQEVEAVSAKLGQTALIVGMCQRVSKSPQLWTFKV